MLDVNKLVLLPDPNVKLLVIANHQSTADVPLLMQTFSARSQYVLLWIMDVVFKWTHFGIVSQMHGDYFLSTKNYKAGDINSHCLKRYSLMKNLILLFPEGKLKKGKFIFTHLFLKGGFRYKRQASSNGFAMKKNLPLLNNVTYPRYSGFSETMSSEVGVTHVVDLTICYDSIDSSPSILDIIRGNSAVSQVHFYYRIYSVGRVLNIRSEAWLRKVWYAKDTLLDHHYENMKALKMDPDGVIPFESTQISQNPSSSSSSTSVNTTSCNGTTGDVEGVPLKNQVYDQLQKQNVPDQTNHNTSLKKLIDVDSDGHGAENDEESSQGENLSKKSKKNTNNDRKMVNNNHHQEHETSVVGGQPGKLPLTVMINDGSASNDSNGELKNNHHSDSLAVPLPSPTGGDPGENPLEAFDPRSGRQVRMSWFKVVAIHVFFLACNFAVYILITTCLV